MIYRIEETTSTNDDAKRPEYGHDDIIWAERQTAGRGQRGHTWISRAEESLTFSHILTPTFTDSFDEFGIDTRIKWTNDIYVGDRKMVGILIEHSYSGPTLARTILGTGINVNQTEFDPALPNPISMAQAAGRRFDREEVLETYRRHAARRYAQLERGEYAALEEEYRRRMYRLGERHPFRLADGTLLEAVIEGVRPTGELLLRHDDGTLRGYLFREVEFVIAGRDR